MNDAVISSNDKQSGPPHAAKPVRLVALISGGGRTLLNLHDRIRAGSLPAEIALVVASRPDAAGIERAAQRGLPVQVVPRKQHPDTADFSARVWSLIDAVHADLVVMAGFMSFLDIPDAWLGRVMNIHPALLPKFGGQGMYGSRVHEAVVAAGETRSGCTVHFANNEYDRGPIVLQRTCPVKPDDTPADVAARVFEQECEAYPEAIRLFRDGALAEQIRAARAGASI